MPSNSDDTVHGSEFGDNIALLGGNDLAFGFGGNDVLNGGTGDDTLLGGDGADVLIGASGVDQLFGMAGSDVFRYFLVSDSGTGFGNRDVIQDFERGVDVIHLSGVDANTNALGNQAFTFIGFGEFSGVAGQLRTFFSSINGNLCLAMDVNGDRRSDMNIELEGNVFSLSGSDIAL